MQMSCRCADVAGDNHKVDCVGNCCWSCSSWRWCCKRANDDATNY